MIIALAGGVGGAKLAVGLTRVLSPDELLLVVNTADDFDHLGFRISPDIDTVMYTLAGLNDPVQGWGLAGETWSFMAALERLGGETWFRLGDKDLATHVVRTRMLAAGRPLSETTRTLCRAFGIAHRIVPMTDDEIRTAVRTADGELDFQDYFVRQRCQPAVRRFDYRHQQYAVPSADFDTALRRDDLSLIVICPSNPFLSIRPILGIPGIEDRLKASTAPVVAVSPIIGGAAVKGPIAKIMRELGHDSSATGIARLYGPLLDGFVLDHVDAAQASEVAALGITPLVTGIMMTEETMKTDLARAVVDFGRSLAAGRVRRP